MRIIMFISTLVLSAGAHAHILLSTPLPRPPNVDRLKQDAANPDPCGSRVRGNTPIIYTPNQMVDFAFEETIEHPGRFKIQFSMTGDQGFAEENNQLAVLEDDDDAQTDFNMKAKMPNLECDSCTLRVIQEMDEQPGQIYVNCIDIQLKGAVINGEPPLVGVEPPDGDANSPSSSEPGAVADAEPKKLPQMSGCGRVSTDIDGGGPGGPMGLLLILTPFLLLAPLRRQTVRKKISRR